MDTSAILMFVVGAIGLWGGLALAIVTYSRASRHDSVGGAHTRRTG